RKCLSIKTLSMLDLPGPGEFSARLHEIDRVLTVRGRHSGTSKFPAGHASGFWPWVRSKRDRQARHGIRSQKANIYNILLSRAPCAAHKARWGRTVAESPQLPRNAHKRAISPCLTDRKRVFFPKPKGRHPFADG